MSGVEITQAIAGLLSRRAEALGRQAEPVRTLARGLQGVLAGRDHLSLDPAEVAARLRPLLVHDERLMRNPNVRLLAMVGSDRPSGHFLRLSQKGWSVLRAESLQVQRRLVGHLGDRWLDVVNVTPCSISAPIRDLLLSSVFSSTRDVLADEGFGDIQLERIELDGERDLGFVIYGEKADPPIMALPNICIWDRKFQQCGIGTAVLLQLIDYAHRRGLDFWITSVANPQPFHHFLLVEGFTGSVHIGPNLNNPGCLKKVRAGAPEIDQVVALDRFDSSPWPTETDEDSLSRLTRSVVRIEIPI